MGLQDITHAIVDNTLYAVHNFTLNTSAYYPLFPKSNLFVQSYDLNVDVFRWKKYIQGLVKKN